MDPALYEKAREGDFQYDIPLAPGVYELHLHFAEFLYTETLENSGVGSRRFHVILNGNSLLNDFDIIMDAPGTNTADEKGVEDVTPDKDGYPPYTLRVGGVPQSLPQRNRGLTGHSRKDASGVHIGCVPRLL